jgi:hypothetical protein
MVSDKTKRKRDRTIMTAVDDPLIPALWGSTQACAVLDVDRKELSRLVRARFLAGRTVGGRGDRVFRPAEIRRVKAERDAGLITVPRVIPDADPLEDPEIPELYNLADAARALGLTKAALSKQHAAGQRPGRVVGENLVVVRRAPIDEEAGAPAVVVEVFAAVFDAGDGGLLYVPGFRTRAEAEQAGAQQASDQLRFVGAARQAAAGALA